MVTVTQHYEAFPYPARDPDDETRRLITGSPSLPREMDHYLWAGQRDWSQPLRVLVAGGGTGDGLIQLAQMMTDAEAPYDITYVDLSGASRAVAEGRARVRGLSGITFHTGSLLDAAGFGQFDYIDCCGVLHHLPDPGAGFAALRASCAPGGGMGVMVYAPLGRSGVYPLQSAFGDLFADLPPADRLTAARAVYARIPDGHPFKRNPHLADHRDSDAGFYDLLLHGQDRAYAVPDLFAELDRAGWALASFVTPALYDLARLAPVPAGMPPATAMALAENLRGTMKVHVAYVVPQGQSAHTGPVAPVATARNRAVIPHLSGGAATALARAVATGKPVPIVLGQTREVLTLPPDTAPLIARIDGRRPVSAIAQGQDPIRFGTLWARIEAELGGFGLLHYSTFGV